VFLSVVPLSGCCNLALLMCGPDTSQWVSVSYATHREALATFMEAIRRDHERVIYETMSDRFKERYGIVGSIETAIAWRKIKSEITGVHLVGSAEVSEAEIVSPDQVRYVLEISSYRFQVAVGRYAYVAVHFEVDGTPGVDERYLDPGVAPDVAITGDDITSDVELTIHQTGLPAGTDRHDLTLVAGGYEWKIDDLRQLTDDT